MTAETLEREWHVAMTSWAAYAWLKFRHWPLWAQVVAWVLGWWLLVPLLAWRSGLPPWAKVALSVFFFVTFLGAGFNGQSDRPAQPEVSSAISLPTTNEAAKSELPIPLPEPAPPLPIPEPVDPAKQLEAALLKKISRSNREGVQRLQVHAANSGLEIVLTWAISESLTSNLTKDGARLDTTEILKVIRSFTAVDYIGARIEGTYSLVDKFGNVTEERVFHGTYSKATIQRINFSNFNFKNVWDITDAPAFIHPAFR